MRNRRSGEYSTWCVPSPSVRTTRPVPSKLTRAIMDVVGVLPGVNAAGAETRPGASRRQRDRRRGPPTRPRVIWFFTAPVCASIR